MIFYFTRTYDVCLRHWIFEDVAPEEYQSSRRLTAPLAAIVIIQGDYFPDHVEVNKIKVNIKLEKRSTPKADSRSSRTESTSEHHMSYEAGAAERIIILVPTHLAKRAYYIGFFHERTRHRA